MLVARERLAGAMLLLSQHPTIPPSAHEATYTSSQGQPLGVYLTMASTQWR
jgi:hypothetical protein